MNTKYVIHYNFHLFHEELNEQIGKIYDIAQPKHVYIFTCRRIIEATKIIKKILKNSVPNYKKLTLPNVYLERLKLIKNKKKYDKKILDSICLNVFEYIKIDNSKFLYDFYTFNIKFGN